MRALRVNLRQKLSSPLSYTIKKLQYLARSLVHKRGRRHSSRMLVCAWTPLYVHRLHVASGVYEIRNASLVLVFFFFNGA